jgi:hypothetical protein
MENIFVQIASYRDPELGKTLNSLFNKAKHPDRLHVCVAHQHNPEDKWDQINKYQDDERVTILDINYTDSQGACWARNKIQKHYQQEEYTLQLDSHHRFVKNWDDKLIKMYKNLQKDGYPKPLITSYIPSYTPDNDPKGRVKEPWAMSFDRFTPEGVVFFLPYTPTPLPKKPIPARFYSAHFTFTSGKHVEEVPHDPSFYFHGEEITLAVRSYTHGYDLFHPHEVIAWHEYTRTGRVKQWDDDETWVVKNNFTHSRVRQLLGVDGEVCSPCNEKSFKEFGLGTERTLKDYETYAGINFSTRKITDRCSKNLNPPGKEGEELLEKYRHPITLFSSYFPDPDHDFCAIIAEKNGQPVYRKDLSKQEIANIKNLGQLDHWIVYDGPHPDHIVVWPHSTTNQWYNKQTINL